MSGKIFQLLTGTPSLYHNNDYFILVLNIILCLSLSIYVHIKHLILRYFRLWDDNYVILPQLPPLLGDLNPENSIIFGQNYGSFIGGPNAVK
jgi:hypothetical protein